MTAPRQDAGERRGIWEPWMPTIGQRVRVRLSAECQVTAYNASPPPSVSDDELREMLVSRMDVAQRYARDEWITGHPEVIDGAKGMVTDINRALDFGHYYRIMFDATIEPGSFIGIDLAAIELEPLSAGQGRSSSRQQLGVWVSSTVALVATVASAAFVIFCWGVWWGSL